MNSQTIEIRDATRSDASAELIRGKEIGQRAGITHEDTSPVFILGHGSSGTSILARLLREELGVAFGTESQFIVRYHQRLGMYGDLSDPKQLRRLVSHLLTERWFARSAKFGFATDVDSILARVESPTYAGVLNAIFSEFASQVGMNRWGSKTPEYNLHLDVIGQIFPDAKYIQMSRDGRDVYVSLTGRYWGPKNIYCAATEWSHEVELVDRFLATIPQDRKIATSYEALSDDPAHELEQILSFLKIADDDGKIRQRIREEIRNKVKQNNHGKWKSQMKPSQIEAYENIACDQLQRHGYETQVKRAAPEKNKLSQLGWQIHNRMTKYTFARYWSDNLYKARLRCVDLWRRALS